MTIHDRYFRPSLVFATGSHIVALDDVQPVAVVFDHSVSVTGIVSWTHVPGPNRAGVITRLAHVGWNEFWVEDGNGAELVYVDLDASPPRASAAASLPTDRQLRTVRFSYTGAGRSAQLPGTWRVRSALNGPDGRSGTSWETSAEFTEAAGSEPRTWAMGAGVTTSAAVSGSTLWVAVRRATKRPWLLRPPAELVRIDPASSRPSVVLGSQELDITAHCRAPHPSAPRPEDVVRECIARLLAIGADAYTSDGIDDLGFAVSGAFDDPVFDLRFRHASRPGVVLVRSEYLLSELGFPQQVGDYGVFLDEDVVCGGLPPLEHARDGVLYV